MDLHLLTNVGVIEDVLRQQMNLLPPSDAILAKLGARGFRVLRDIYNEPFVYGAVNSRKSGVLLADWTVQGNGAEEVMEWLSKLPVSKIIEQVLDAIFFGFQVFEINWNEDLIPVEVVQRLPEHFRLKGEDLVFVGRGLEETFPREKFIYIAFGQSLYEIYGSAVLSKVYYYHLFLKEVTRLWVKYVEKFGSPFTEVKAVGSEVEQAQIAEKIAKAISNSVLVHEPGLEVNFLDISQKDGGVFVALIEHCKNAISQAILGHERGTQSTSGKLGNEQMATIVREDIVRQDRRLVERFFDTLIGYYWNLRYDSEQPYFYFVDEEDINVERAKRDEILTRCGVVFSREYWKRVYNLGDEDVVFEAFEKKTDEVDELLNEAMEKDLLGYREKSKEVIEKLKKIKSYEEGLKMLGEIFVDLTSEEAIQKMEKLLMWAYLNGVANEGEI